MAQALKSQACANHSERAARAVCMSCKKAVCQECATQWEGINYCVHCLRNQRKQTTVRSSMPEAVVVLVASVALFFLAGYLMLWSSVNLARML